MKSFLAELSEQLYQQYKDNLQEVTLVFPNRRAGLFFRKYLAQHIEKPVWAPQILSIDDFVKSMSELESADQLTLLFILYDAYSKVSPKKETFDQFYYWGEMLLGDFDDIDKYMVRAGDLFVDLKNQKDIEQQFQYLTDEQIETIRRFWNSFSDKPSRHQEDFLMVWNILEKVYGQFKAQLKEEGVGYDGMIFREVAERIVKDDFVYDGRQVVFAGFNALTKAEEDIIASMLKKAGAAMYWDLDRYYFEDDSQEAGYFLRRYAGHKVIGATFPENVPDNFLTGVKKIEMVGVPLAVGQAKLLGELLDEVDKHNPERTAIVLPDEQILFPVLHSLPEAFEDINITMGYPLKDTALNGFLEHVLNLQQHVQESRSGKITLYYAHVVSLMKHPYFFHFHPEQANTVIKNIESKNIMRVALEDMPQEGLFGKVFQQVKDTDAVFEYLLEILGWIHLAIRAGEVSDRLDMIEREYVFHFYTQLKRLKEIATERKVVLTMPTFLKLFKQIVYGLKLPFSGEPLNGLQVMGVLETRNLDFDNVYILSMNEGNFPPGINQSSFIPFNLRKGYNLPTYEHQDAIYAYSFYRLLQRAKKIVLFYNTESGIKTGGEMSRFLYQLQYEVPIQIQEHVLSNTIKVPAPKPIVIEKDERVLKLLDAYCNEETSIQQRMLTPSAFNTYLDCRLKFYFRYVVRMYEPDRIQEEIDAPTFGNLFHTMMERFYTHVCVQKGDKRIESHDLDNDTLLHTSLEEAFMEHYHWQTPEEVHFEGRNLIVRDIILKMGRRILKNDQAYAPFEILRIENSKEAYTVAVPISTGKGEKQVWVKGIIDRVDLKNGVVRVLDYKTGKDDKRFDDVPSLFDRNNKKRNKAAMQTLMYSLLYAENETDHDHVVTPGLYNVRELFSANFDVHLMQRDEVGKRNATPLIDARSLLPEVKSEMKRLLEEVFDPGVPFGQTDNLRICDYCPYAGICHR